MGETMTQDDLRALAERVEAGEDDALWGEILVALASGERLETAPVDYVAIGRAASSLGMAARALESVDAALALKERVLPGWMWALTCAPSGTVASVRDRSVLCEDKIEGRAAPAAPARALVAAILRAKAEMETVDAG